MMSTKKAEYQRKYRQENKVKLVEYRRKYRQENRTKIEEQELEYRQMNKAKIAEYNREYRQKNREKLAKMRRNNHLQCRYGITLEDYDQMLEVQQGRCAVCSSKPQMKRLAVDHNHSTGKVRGLLCDRCNRALGLLNDDYQIAKSMESYLRENTLSLKATAV